MQTNLLPYNLTNRIILEHISNGCMLMSFFVKTVFIILSACPSIHLSVHPFIHIIYIHQNFALNLYALLIFQQVFISSFNTCMLFSIYRLADTILLMLLQTKGQGHSIF